MKQGVELAEQDSWNAHLNSNSDVRPKERNVIEREDSLAARLRAGDRLAAEELVDAYYERIYSFMRGIGHGSQLSEDLTQETFLRAWYHIGQLRHGKALTGWLFRIAGNVSKLYWRRYKGEFVSIEELSLPDGSASQPDIIAQYEQLTRLRHAVDTLPWKLRQAIVLHYMQQLTIAEAAEAARIKEGTFKSRLNRALVILRKQLG